MPRVMKQVEADVSVDELNKDLADSLGEIDQGGVFLLDATGNRLEPISDGDFLVPNDDLYKTASIVPETCVYVVTTVPKAGIFWGVFHRVPGGKGVQFFNGASFTGKYIGDSPAKAPRKALRR